MTTRSDVRFEFRSGKVRIGPPVYVTYGELQGLQGYQSQFGVPVAQARANTEAGQTKGAKYAVYSDILLVDFDDCLDRANSFDARLRHGGIAFIRAVSGGRSDHFHIAIEPMFGPDVPYSCKLWVAANAPGADLSVYHRNGMFRLFGTRHEKTGRIKELTGSNQGSRLTIPYHEEEPHVSWGTSHVSDLEAALGYALSLLQSEPGVGARHQALWSFARSLADAAAENVPDPGAFIEGFLHAINATWTNRKDTSDLHRIMRDLKL
jgi:hypothetical protein